MDPFKDSDLARAGLCAACRHVKINRSDRGATFYYCLKSETDSAYRKYPTIPVLDCPGHEPPSGASGPSR